MRCEHCRDGLMLVDNFDADVQTCSSCGRSTFTPSAEVLADVGQSRPSCSASHIHGRGVAVAGRGREPSILRQGSRPT